MKLQVAKTTERGPEVSDLILGHNIEMCLTTAHGLLSDRLRNPKLVGPAHGMTCIAPEWQGASCGGAFYELTPGAGLMGSEALLIRAVNPGWNQHLHQNKIHVKAGEELEVEIWARAWHEPVTLDISLRPVAARAEAYDSGQVVVDASYYKCYKLRLQAKRNDDEARLAINLINGGALWIDQVHLRPKDESLLCKPLLDEMAKMRIPTLRFPGGIVTNAYNWKHGTGPAHLRPAMFEAAFHQDWELNYDFGLDEFLQICQDQGIMPTLTVNVATGTPEEAGELARYCVEWYRAKSIDPPQIYWHIANHPYYDTTAHMTAEMYANVIDTFVPIIKDNYPNCRIVGVMAREAMTGVEVHMSWLETLVTRADMIDVVEFQDYAGCDPEADISAQADSLDEALKPLVPDIRKFIAECRERKVNWNVGIAEWNWWEQASHWDGRHFQEDPTWRHGLFIAGRIHRYAELAPDFEVAHFYNLVNCMGILNHRDAGVEATQAVLVFNLYRDALPGRLVKLDVSGATERIDTMCLENEEGTWLFVINRNAKESAQVSLEGFDTEGAVFEGDIGANGRGRFIGRMRQPLQDPLVVPPLSVFRVKMNGRVD